MIVARIVRMAFRLYPFQNGRGQLIHRSFLNRIRFPQRTLDVACSGGFRMAVFPNDLIGRHIALTGEFDPTIVNILQPYCSPGATLLDIGANIGYVSCALLHAVPGLRVLAIEPQPEVFALLSRNLAAAGGGRGAALQAAISEQEGAAHMVLEPANCGAARLGAAGEGTLPVRTMTVAQALQSAGIDRVDVVKIDVEGHEGPVLRSLSEMFPRFRPRAIVFEHHSPKFDPDGTIRDSLENAGYEIKGIRKRLNGWSAEPLEYFVRTGRSTYDYLAVLSPTPTAPTDASAPQSAHRC